MAANKKLAPKTDCGRTKGYPFCLAFVYLPDGLQVFSGSLDRIHEHLKDVPTSHGFVKFYSKQSDADALLLAFLTKRPPRKEFASADLFGKFTISNHRLQEGYFYLHRTCQADLAKTSLYQYIRPFAEKRKKYILVWNGKDGSEKLIGKWRNMPPCHLKEMADFERSLKEEVSCV